MSYEKFKRNWGELVELWIEQQKMCYEEWKNKGELNRIHKLLLKQVLKEKKKAD